MLIDILNNSKQINRTCEKKDTNHVMDLSIVWTTCDVVAAAVQVWCYNQTKAITHQHCNVDDLVVVELHQLIRDYLNHFRCCWTMMSIVEYLQHEHHKLNVE
jgi:hypothetical protein